MILRGDCVEVMAGMDAGSVDAIVTDPPYGLGFMGKQWDELPPGREWADQCLRVLKPGGHLLAFGGTRTYHRLTVAIEDAGFEIRDQIMWLYGSGFPKSLDVSKAIDKAAGELKTQSQGFSHAGHDGRKAEMKQDKSFRSDYGYKYAPATEDAAKWEGWGTALKPAHEPVVVARKPLIGTVAANVLEHGTGALNIDGCRVGTELITAHGGGQNENRTYGMGKGIPAIEAGSNPHIGRWPANTVLDEDAAAILDAEVGELKSPKPYKRGSGPTGNPRIYGNGAGIPQWSAEGNYGDTGGPSRFFYVAKASRKERNAGLDDRNTHPTVKPINLMRWLVRLVTPPGGTVLDPFTGSGTTGCAAALESLDFIGIEREPEYADIAEARIKHWTPDQLELA